jgi:hypothetical protein
MSNDLSLDLLLRGLDERVSSRVVQSLQNLNYLKHKSGFFDAKVKPRSQMRDLGHPSVSNLVLQSKFSNRGG